MCRRTFLLVSLGFLLCVTAGSTRADLVAYWPMDEGSGTTVGDMMGMWDGTITGDVTWIDGHEGMALDFPGGNNFVNFGNVEIGPSMTLSYWCFNAAKTFERPLGQQAGNYTTVPGWAVYSRDEGEGGVWFRVHGADDAWNGGDIIIADILPKDEWYHLAFTFDGETRELKGYYDGEMKASKICEAGRAIYPAPSDLRLGNTGAGGAYTGALDEVAVWDHVMDEDEILAAMDGHLGGANPNAARPEPEDGALYESNWANLRWKAGGFAVSHDVYIGTNFDDVNDGAEDTFVGSTGGVFQVVGFPGFPFPDGLQPGTTYYWRVDEVNDANAASPWKGDVWSFSVPPKTAYFPDPIDGAEFVDLDATFSWTPGFDAKLHTVYMGDSFEDIDNATGGSPLGTPSYTPASPLESEKVYYWRVDEFDIVVTHKGDVWAFTTPGAAGNSQPANGAVDVQILTTLSWTPADTAASSDLYFGVDADAVKNATAASPEHIGNKALGSESHDPGKLALDATYYWRVDAVYADKTVKGLPWSFTSAAFIGVDDFETYNDVDPPDPNSNIIFNSWIDGFGTTTNGALVGNDLPPYAGQTVVNGGAQSMPCFYDNNLKTSEATLTLVYPKDWTQEGVTRLSVWFRGDTANAAERMFIALNGTAVVYNDDASATQINRWTEWSVDLTRFADQGVNLANVNTITIGFGTKGSPAAGGTGTMFFDDIRLY